MNDNAIDKIDRILSELLEMASRYMDQDSIQRLRDEYEEKKNDSLLQVMLFGSYNAGKSSLINALLMEEVAATGDVPKTALADRYYWNGCYLLDTPGVNAPIEHEAITQAQIDRSELILFVIRQGDQDVKDVYERMFNMLARNKQIFIVFNHELNPDDLPEALDRLTGIMAEYAASHQIDLQRVGGIPVLVVNINTAIRARLKGSEALAEHSGITRFEATFTSWLRQFDSEHHYIDRLRKHIYQCIVTPLLSAIVSEVDGENEEQLKELQYQREETIRQYTLLESQVANHIRSEMVHLKPKIANILSESTSQLEMESEMLKLGDTIVRSTSDFLEQRCEAIVNELDVNVAVSVQPQGNEERSRIGDAIGKVVQAGAKGVDQEALKKGLLFLRKMKVPGIKGRWEKTLGKWTGKAGWVLTLAVSAYEIYSASSKQDKENKELERQTLSLHQLVEGAASDIVSAVLDESQKLISATKQQTLADIDLSIQKITENCERHTIDKETVKRLASNLEEVQV